MPARYGGVERHVHDLSVGLVKAGYDVTVYNRKWYGNGQETVNGVHIVTTPSIHTKHLDAFTHALSSTFHAMLEHTDIIHYHGVGPALLSWIPRLFSPNTKVVTTFHSIDRYHEKWGVIARLALRLGEWAACTFAHETITISQSLQQYCRNEFNKETTYIPNAVVESPYTGAQTELKTFGLQAQQYLVMISRLVPHKGAHILVEAFQKLKRDHKDDPEIQALKLAIVGGSVYTNNYVQQLQIQASQSNDIVFTDFQSGETLEALYRQARVLVHPSLNEGLPMTVLQAMNSDVPVLVSNIPEHLELVRDPQFIFQENDVDALYQALYNHLQLSKQELQEVTTVHKQRVENEYSWDVLIPKIINVYETDTKQSLPAIA